ncbi:CBS domain-containing protein [uncultured Methanomethylovorans sp.]|uniref:CBS domain-containing protein n=1 Tax=uncultured Methanomethylovorans sp. TaxID=183759 RepID=UPI002AA85458|nr:CBS domain-containing protein [uncultured Methanomethylovorans sp.]
MHLPTPDSIRQKRNELGLTQSELAKRAGVSQPLIARIEAGDVDPRLSTLKRILNAFDASEEESHVLARNLMNTKVISISADEPVDAAVRIMGDNDISQIPVVENGVPIGSISEETIVRSMAGKKALEVSKMKIRDLMGDTFPVVSPGTHIKLVSHLLETMPAVIVLERGQIAGVVTKHDLMKLLRG